MNTMLFALDSLFGHVIEDTPEGPIYQDDGSAVDFAHPRPCAACKVQVTTAHDACIINLPGVAQACCGHGLDSTSGGQASGYVSFEDGRCIRFSGLVGGVRIRTAVDAFLAGKPLPEGFDLDQEPMWWQGLSDAERRYVDDNMTGGLARQVLRITGKPASNAFLEGSEPWWDDLTEDHIALVWDSLEAMLQELVVEAKACS